MCVCVWVSVFQWNWWGLQVAIWSYCSGFSPLVVKSWICFIQNLWFFVPIHPRLTHTHTCMASPHSHPQFCNLLIRNVLQPSNGSMLTVLIQDHDVTHNEQNNTRCWTHTNRWWSMTHTHTHTHTTNLYFVKLAVIAKLQLLYRSLWHFYFCM